MCFIMARTPKAKDTTMREEKHTLKYPITPIYLYFRSFSSCTDYQIYLKVTSFFVCFLLYSNE